MERKSQLLRDLGLKRNHNLAARDLLRRLGAAQNGQFARPQALELGLTPAQVRAMRACGETIVVRPGVGRFAWADEPDPAVTAFLACWPHGVISHASAARYHGLTRVAMPSEPSVTVSHGRTCRQSGIDVHYSRTLSASDVLRVGPLRYTTLARTPCDLATSANPWETLSIVDDSIAAGAKRKWINQVAASLAAGRDGVALVERATRVGASNEFRSWLERAGAHVFARGGLPNPRWNVRVHDDDGLIGVVDSLWLSYNVVCELKGLRFHTTPAQLRRDDQRNNRLLDAGYGVRSVSWRDLVDDAPGAVATVMRALNVAGAEMDVAAIPREISLPGRPFR